VRNVAVSIVCAMLMAEKMAATAEVVVEMATAEVVERWCRRRRRRPCVVVAQAHAQR